MRNSAAMKVLYVVLPLGLALAGCEQKQSPEEVAATQETAKKQEAARVAEEKRKNWMWDKERGNPLEKAPTKHSIR